MNPAQLSRVTDRRGFLRGSLGGALILGFAPLLPAGCGGYPRRKDVGEGDAPFQVLDDKSAAVFEAIADAMVDDGSGRMPKPSELGIARRVDAMLAGLHPAVQRETRLLFNVVEHMTLPFGGRFRRFTKLDAADQQAYIAGWAQSSLDFRRMAFQAMKMFVYVNYYSFDETWEAIGYDGPWVDRFEIPYFAPPLAAYTKKDPL